MSDQQDIRVNVPDDAGKVIADELAKQLGSDQASLEIGAVDMRRLSVLNPDAIAPLIYCSIRGQKSRAFRKVFNQYLNLVVSGDGRGRRDIIRMEMASRGGAANVDAEIKKPGWIERHITNRDWEQEERRRLGM
jgi:hypothetical protein